MQENHQQEENHQEKNYQEELKQFTTLVDLLKMCFQTYLENPDKKDKAINSLLISITCCNAFLEKRFQMPRNIGEQPEEILNFYKTLHRIYAHSDIVSEALASIYSRVKNLHPEDPEL